LETALIKAKGYIVGQGEAVPQNNTQIETILTSKLKSLKHAVEQQNRTVLDFTSTSYHFNRNC
jgi:hypothetical protein